MPQRDGKGPDGKGAKTGRGLGNCIPVKVPENQIDKKNLPKEKDLKDQDRGLGRKNGKGRGDRRN